MTQTELDNERLSALSQLLGEKYESAIKQYLDDVGTLLETINTAIKKERIEELTQSCENLNSSSKHFGAVGLSSIARKLEYLSKKPSLDTNAINDLYQQAINSYNIIKEQLVA